jgi:hypothetical protein
MMSYRFNEYAEWSPPTIQQFRHDASHINPALHLQQEIDRRECHSHYTHYTAATQSPAYDLAAQKSFQPFTACYSSNRQDQ